MSCVKLRVVCTEDLAASRGTVASPAVCRACAHYDGPPRGLGDRIHAVAEAVGVHKVVRACGGCAERRRLLNRKFPSSP